VRSLISIFKKGEMDNQARQEYIRAAVSFLQDPKLVGSSLQDKLKFLKNKGLSQVEVDEALNLALINRNQSHSSRWNFFLVVGLFAAAYKIYQAYEKNYDQSASKRTEDVSKREGKEERCAENKENMSFAEILKQVSELKTLLEIQQRSIQREIQSMKTLLLGHEKFAAPPAIPAWQLKDAET